jgi:hypothetical protein
MYVGDSRNNNFSSLRTVTSQDRTFELRSQVTIMPMKTVAGIVFSFLSTDGGRWSTASILTSRKNKYPSIETPQQKKKRCQPSNIPSSQDNFNFSLPVMIPARAGVQIQFFVCRKSRELQKAPSDTLNKAYVATTDTNK